MGLHYPKVFQRQEHLAATTRPARTGPSQLALIDNIRNDLLTNTPGSASAGLYNKGDSLARMSHGFITGSVYLSLFRAMATEQDNLDKCRYHFFRSIALVVVYAAPLYVALLWLAEPLIRGVYGPKWTAASPLLILSFACHFFDE